MMLRRVTFAVVPLLVLLIGAEIGLRLMRTSELVQRPRPQVIEGHHVVALGDSWTFGYGLDESESWPGQLAALTDREVVNLGEPGLPPGSAARSFRIWAGRPELVIVLVGANPEKRGRKAPRPEPGFARSIALFRLVEQVVVRTRHTPPPPPAAIGRKQSDVDRALVRLREMTRMRDSELLVLTYPLPADVECGLQEVNDWIRQITDRHRIRLLDLETVHADLGRDAMLHETGLDLHPGAQGYARMARAIADELEGLSPTD